MSNTVFKIDLAETFEHLGNAPIVEAVIHWRARAEATLEPNDLLRRLKEKLSDYPYSQRQQEFGVGAEFGPEGSSIRQHHNWHGFRFESEDKIHVAQFTRNGFVFSRLKPYDKWEQFEAEAQRLWHIYRELAEPSEIQRLGVRFINLTPVRLEELSDLLTVPPHSPSNMQLPLRGFMHQNTFDIPSHPYNLNVIQTIQPPSLSQSEAFGLILDLDVFTVQTLELDDEELKKRLMEMRWIKNKAFFTFLKEKAIAHFKE